MKKVIFIWLVCQFVVSALASSRVTVDQLSREIASSQGKQDTKIASRLSGLELTERLNGAKLAGMEKALPGPESRRALLLLADQAMFINPPLEEIPNEPAPSFDQQRAIMAKTVDYVTTMVHRLPNLFAHRDTIHFEDTPPGMYVTLRSGTMLPPQPLHPVSRSSETVLYRDGQDFVEVAGKELTVSTKGTTGLASFGEFGPILATVLSDLPRGKLAWSHWEQGVTRPVAVFSFAVPKPASHYQVSFCCGDDRAFMQFSGYHGEITIDTGDGTILRLTLIADLGKDGPIRKADLMVEYGPVELGGQKYFCPMRSVSVSLARHFGELKQESGFTREDVLAAAPLQIMLNEVVFDNYHLFHSEARILMAGNSELAPTSAATANSPAAPVEPPTTNLGVEPPVTSGDSAPAASAAGVVATANETAPALPSSAAPPPIAATPAVPSKPEISVVSPSDLPLTPAVPAGASIPSGYSLRISTRLVDTVVTAYDKKGRPIADLTRDDFEVSDNGKKQVLRSFSRVCAEPAYSLTSATSAQPILYSNRLDVKGSDQPGGTCSPGSLTIVLLDVTSLDIAHFTRVRDQIFNFLDRLPASESIGLYVRDGAGFRVLAEATANRAELRSALRGWMPDDQKIAPGQKEAMHNLQLAEAAQFAGDMNYMNGTIGGNASGTQNVYSVWEIPGETPGGGSGAHVDRKLMAEGSERTRQSLMVLGAVAAHMGAIPGHKNLVWLAANTVLADWTEQMAGSSNGPYSLASIAVHIQEAFNDARVSLYPLGASQIETAVMDARLQNDRVQQNPTVLDRNPNEEFDNVSTLPGTHASEELRQNVQSVHGAFQEMAEATGGRSFTRSKSAVTDLVSVIENRRATYLLSFTPGTLPDDRFHRLAITVPTRRGIALRYRAGYLYSKEPTSLRDRFEQVIWQPLDATEIALSVRRTSASAGSTVLLNIAATEISLVEKGDRWRGKVDIFLVQRDQVGMRADVNEQTLALDLKPGTYERVLRDGIPFDQYFDKKQDTGIVRIIVVDENSGRIGSITLPAATGSTKQ